MVIDDMNEIGGVGPGGECDANIVALSHDHADRNIGGQEAAIARRDNPIPCLDRSVADIEFKTRRLYVREDLVVQEWTASATHVKPLSRGELVAEPSGKRIEWKGMDVIPFAGGKVKRKDVYSDSVSILRQVGLL